MSKRINFPAYGDEYSEADESTAAKKHEDSNVNDAATNFGLPTGDDSLSRQARRNRTNPLTRTVRWTAVGLSLLAVALLLKMAAPRDEPTGRETVILPTGNAGRPGNNQPDGKPSSGDKGPAVTTRVLKSVEENVVRIESVGPNGNHRLGAGFVIDSLGLVATNYHVIAPATTAQVRFKDNVVYDVAGYAAVDPDNDLALLMLRDPPDNLQALTLYTEAAPGRLDNVLALGHPRGVSFSLYSGQVSQLVSTEQLPVQVRQFLEIRLRARGNHRWIQHTAILSPGNSGGPLIDDEGRVLGVNTWVDRQAGYGYALHASHLNRLRGRMLTEIAPLRRFASADARRADNLRRLSAEHARQLFQQARKMQWRPRSLSDYEVLQQLAWSVTYPKLEKANPSDAMSDAQREQLIKAVDEIQVAVQHEKWDAFGQITLVNELAHRQIDRPQSGAFFFATVERLVEGHDGARGLLMRLAGFDKMVFIPLDNILSPPSPGTHCLVLGINHEGRRVQWGDNPLQLSSASVISSQTIVPLVR